MPLKDLPADAQPREKLLARGPAALADAELLAILLRTGIVGKGVLQMAQELLDPPGIDPDTGAITGGFGGIDLRDVGRDVLAIARDGLNARGLDEALFLDPLDAILASGETKPDRWLKRFDKIWHGDSRMKLREAAI